ncbi:DUF6282 family protein [Bacillus inaquosorum]|uniref:DUF6282 family protein n=1 Tax=Bacillus inaquosorum TaxID=483913 RepID=UPI002E2223A9|nr:DUF6282 family protein [Bacillus inaquosorum]MED1543121.1 DUF6282 family protein [Bacillus inaquosorum]
MNLTKGIIDMHVHSYPDMRERSHNDLELLEQAKKLEVSGIVIKSHHMPTVERAWFLNKLQSDVKFFGSMTLNKAVGGLNPFAVNYALEMGAKTIWLPTIHASNHLKKEGKGGGITPLKDGKVKTPLIDILKLIAERNAILATGHISPEEIITVIEEAKKQNVNKIVVTHPEFHIVGMPIALQRKLAETYHVFFERTYAQPIGNGKYKINLETNLASAKAVGYNSTIIASDSGQIENPLWKDSISEYIQYFKDNGVSQQDIDIMTKTNLEKLLGFVNE